MKLNFNEYNQLILHLMSSFLFEKEEIHCSCFDNSPKQASRIFRTQSYHSQTNTNKDNKQASLRNQSLQGKHKKKSLKKEKQVSCVGSESDPKEKQQIHKDIFIPQIPIGTHNVQHKRQQKAMGFEYIQPVKYQNLKSERIKPGNNLRSNRMPHPVIQEPIVFQTAHQINLKIPISNIYSEHVIPQREYDQMITKQFQQDLIEFKHHMQTKQNQQDTKRNFKPQTQRQNKQDGKQKQNSRKESISIHKLTLENLQYQKKPSHHDLNNKVSASELHQRTPARLSSFRNSAVSNKQKQSITKRIKGKMLPKEIESQKDGSDTESDQMSEVVGRGWDGLTQQRIEIQELDQMMKQDKFNSETMVTQQSHIKNSEIKTLTDYSNSFISPKSHHTKNVSFGGGHKYGITGMSYQHIEDLGKVRLPSHSRLPF